MWKKTLAWLTAVLITISLPALTSEAPQAHAAAGSASSKVQIMITGDSMSQGATGGHSWRYFVWRSLTEPQSYDFVGNLNGPAIFMAPWARKNDPSNYADPHFDYNHASIAGDTVCPDRRRLYGEKSIGELVRRYRPNIIVGAYGINDLGLLRRTPAQAIACYGSWIDSARAVNPNVDFVIARLPWTWGNPVNSAKFNALLGWMARTRTSAQSRIVLAQMPASYHYNARDDAYDHIHPNKSGDVKIAAMMASALKAQGVRIRAAALLPGNTFAPNLPPGAPRLYSSRQGKRITLRVMPAPRATRYTTYCDGHVVSTRSGYARFTSTKRQVCRTKATSVVGYMWSNATVVRRSGR